MSADPREVVQAYLTRVVGGGELDAIDELVDPTFHNDDPPAGVSPDREGLRAAVMFLRNALDEFSLHIERIEEPDADDWVAALVTMSGRLTRDAFGALAGDQTRLPLLEHFRLSDGRIVERRAGN